MKSQNNSKVIKRPKKIISHKRQHLTAGVHAKMATAGDLTMTPTLRQQKKLNSSNPNQTASTSFSRRKANKKRKRNPKIQRKKVTENGPKSSLKELHASKRQNWVALNKKQTEFISNAMNAAVSFAMSQTDTESVEKFELQSSCLHATRSILIQSVSKVKVPPTKQSIAQTNSRAKYIEMSKNMDDTIHSLTEAIDKEKKLLREREKLFKDK